MKTSKLGSICFLLTLACVMCSCGTSKNSSSPMLIGRLQMDKPIKGACDNSNIIAILPFPGNGQVEAKAPKTDEEIVKELNSKVTFLVDKPNYEDKGMVNLIVNCKGDLIRCEIDNKTKSPELDAQIVAVFAELKKWTSGTINGISVDTSVLYSFTIKNGKISL